LLDNLHIPADKYRPIGVTNSPTTIYLKEKTIFQDNIDIISSYEENIRELKNIINTKE